MLNFIQQITVVFMFFAIQSNSFQINDTEKLIHIGIKLVQTWKFSDFFFQKIFTLALKWIHYCRSFFKFISLGSLIFSQIQTRKSWILLIAFHLIHLITTYCKWPFYILKNCSSATLIIVFKISVNQSRVLT